MEVGRPVKKLLQLPRRENMMAWIRMIEVEIVSGLMLETQYVKGRAL